MSIQSEADWRGLRRVAAVAREALDALERAVHAGVTTLDLDRIAAAIFAKRGARSAPALVYGFPGTVLISVNDEIVHGVPGTRRSPLQSASDWIDMKAYSARGQRAAVRFPIPGPRSLVPSLGPRFPRRAGGAPLV